MTATTLQAYAQTALGIVVSIVLFLAGYRQTIGARKERARAAAASLHRALLRRLVLEGYEPRDGDLEKLVEGKANEFQVRVTDLPAPDHFLVGLFTEVFDSDLIPPPQRAEIENKLRGMIHLRSVQASTRIAESESDTSTVALSGESRSGFYIFLLGIAASLLGATVPLAPQLLRGELVDPQVLRAGLAVFVTSIGAMFGILVFRRSRDVVSDLPLLTGVQRAAEFETRVAQLLDRHGLQYRAGVRVGNREADFVVEVPGGTVVLEVKNWLSAVPLGAVQRTLDTSDALGREFGARETLIVVPDRRWIPRPFVRAGATSFVSLKDLPAALKRTAA